MSRISVLFLFLLPVVAFSQPRFASVFTDNMVVKQCDTISIWGTATAASGVRVCASWWPNDTINATADPYGYWMVKLPTPKADLKPHTISCNNVVLRNVLLGEVWLCSGQSNMEWSVNHGIENGEKEAAAATNPNIRILKVPLLAARTPQNSIQAAWEECNEQSMRRASAVGYFFARTLSARLGVPVGIISSAWGGANAEAFVPSDVMQADSELYDGRVRETSSWRPIDPGSMYNQMIYPLMPMTLSGILWYQGESNRENADIYDRLMGTLIESWRAGFKRHLPFYFVQIAPFDYGTNDLLAAQVRQQQAKTASRVSRTAMVSIMDKTGNVNDIHPRNKVVVGDRLAAIALCEVYGHRAEGYKSPVMESYRLIPNGRIVVNFAGAQCGLRIEGREIAGMKVAASDGVFVRANAVVAKDGKSIEIWADEVKNPMYVRYCFDDTSIGNIFTTTGLPVAPFRTDNLPISNHYKNK